MKFKFIDLDGIFTAEINRHFKTFQDVSTETISIENIPRSRSCFVSPANCMLFMDGGVDRVLSQEIFPGLEKYVRHTIQGIGRESLVGKKYLPIGSAMLTKYKLGDGTFSYMISSPTMLLPQSVRHSRNAYYAMRAVLNVLNQYEARYPGEIDEIVIPCLCGGWGKLPPDQSAQQIRWAFIDHDHLPKSALEVVWYSRGVMVIDAMKQSAILEEQPLFYENSEFKKIHPSRITSVRD